VNNADHDDAGRVSRDSLFHGVQDVLPFGVARAELEKGQELAVSDSERRARWEAENGGHRAGSGKHQTVAEYITCPWCCPIGYATRQGI